MNRFISALKLFVFLSVLLPLSCKKNISSIPDGHVFNKTWETSDKQIHTIINIIAENVMPTLKK